MAGIEYAHGRAGHSRDFPTHWGTPPPTSEEVRRIAWIKENIAADEATGVPAARRARRLLEEHGAKLSPSVWRALVAIRDSGGLGPKG